MVPPAPPDPDSFRVEITLDELHERATKAPRRRRVTSAAEGVALGAREARDDLALRDLALRATALAAARRGAARRPSGILEIHPCDLRRVLRERHLPVAVLFLVDSSSSMRRAGRMSKVKALLRHYLREAHRRRHRIALATFRHDTCRMEVPFTSNTLRGERAAQALAVGGRTPLAEGMALALRALRRERYRDPELRTFLVLISDGRPNLTLRPGGDPSEEAIAVAGRIRQNGTALALIDPENDPMAMGVGYQVAHAAGGAYELLPAVIRKSRR